MNRSHALAIAALRHVKWDADSTIIEIETGRLTEVSRSALVGADLVDDFRRFLADMRLALGQVNLDVFVRQYLESRREAADLQVIYPALDVLLHYADVDPATIAVTRAAA